MVKLHTRELTPPQVARAKQVLATVTASAESSWLARDERTIIGRLAVAGFSLAAARGAAGVFFLTGTETVGSFLPRFIALAADAGLLVGAGASQAETDVDTSPRSEAVASADWSALAQRALRVTVPTPVMVRRAAGESRIGSVAVRPGDRVLLLTVNALWREPWRAAQQDLWFGAGPHFCLGRWLALAQAEFLATELVGALAPGRRIEVVRRRAARRVLIPTWRQLELRADPVSKS
jgi:cytochrome P450